MNRIPLLRNTYLSAYLSALRSRQVNPRNLLDRYGIPEDFQYLPDYMLASPLLHRFILDAARCDIPGAVSTSAGLYNAAYQINPFSDSLGQATTLGQAITAHNANSNRYSPENRFELTEKGDQSRWRKRGRSPVAETEIFCVANLVGHLRSLLSAQWRPQLIEVSVASPRVLKALPAFAGIAIRSVSSGTSVVMATRCLAEPIDRRRHSPCPGATPVSRDDLDFLATLRLIMRSYARTGNLSAENSATAAGTSKRTLQRRLNALGTSYSALADQVLFEVAAELLANEPGMKITQIGYELGYRDPGSFSRAFKRFASETPAAYRGRLMLRTTQSQG